MAQIAIAIHYEGQDKDDHYHQVVVEHDMEADQMIEDIRGLWQQFQSTEPDSDGLFSAYLEERGYRTLGVEPIALVLNG